MKIYNVMCATESLEKNMTVGKGSNAYQAIGEATVLNVIKPLFKQEKLIMLPTKTVATEITEQYPDPYDKTKTKTKSMTQLLITFILVDAETGESIEVEVAGNGFDSLDKGTGKATTYAYKTALQKTFMLFSGEDTDAHHSNDQYNNSPSEQSQQQSNQNNSGDRKVTTQQLIEIAAKKGYCEDKLKKKYNVQDVKYIKAAIKIEAYDNFAKLPDKS